MLNGKNIRLRALAPDDAELLAQWWSDPEYMGPYYNILPFSRHMMETWIANSAHGPYNNSYLILSSETGEPMGTAGYANPFSDAFGTHFRSLEPWAQIHPDFRDRGVATQFGCLMINHLFNTRSVERIQATCVVENEVASSVAEKSGMHFEGICRRLIFLHGRYVDVRLYSIVREDWNNEDQYRHRCPEF